MKLKDIFFDDDRWVVRYLVVDIGGWLNGRNVLILPYAATRTDRQLYLGVPTGFISHARGLADNP